MHKVAQNWFVLHETLNTTLFGIYYFLEVVGIESQIRVKLRFFGFLSVFGTFVHKVAQIWFVFQQTWLTTLFGIYIIVLKLLE